MVCGIGTVIILGCDTDDRPWDDSLSHMTFRERPVAGKSLLPIRNSQGQEWDRLRPVVPRWKDQRRAWAGRQEPGNNAGNASDDAVVTPVSAG